MRRLAEPSYALVYAAMIPAMQEVARSKGYALTVHGSMATDLDLVAVPWTQDACDAEELVQVICLHFKAFAPVTRFEPEDDPNPSPRAHGRLAYCLHFDHRTEKGLPHGGPYIDLSVMPRQSE